MVEVRKVSMHITLLLLLCLILTPQNNINTLANYEPRTNGKIAFHSNRDGNWEIYIMNPDGSDQRRITNNTYDDAGPAWSPDGSKIAFASDRDGNDEIYMMNADGTGQTRLTNNNLNDSGPIWSPDGTKILYSRDLGGNWEIYAMNADGSGETRLTNNNGPWDLGASYSPDGTKILFLSHRDGDSDIYVMNPDGSGQTILTNNNSMEELATWSPDGTKIVFSSNRDGNYEIYVMNVDGSGQTRLTNNNFNDYHNCWSPDGTKIAFLSYRDGNDEIYVMNVDGSGQTRLTNNNASDVIYGSAWQNKQTAALTLQSSTTNTIVNTSFNLDATLSSPRSGATTLYWSINNSGFNYRQNGTITNGKYGRTFAASTPGTWAFKLVWAGDDQYKNATSNIITVTIKPTPTLNVAATTTPATVYSGGASIIRASISSGGAAVAGASVGLASSNGGVFSTVVDKGNGTYVATFTAPDIVDQTTCTITASATKSGYQSGSTQTQVTVQPLILNINVKADDGAPIAGVAITSTSQPSGQVALAGNTDVNGRVSFNKVQKGAYTFKAAKSDYDDKIWVLTVQGGQPGTELITLTKRPSGGIPGYPLLSIGLALIVALMILRRSKASMKQS